MKYNQVTTTSDHKIQEVISSDLGETNWYVTTIDENSSGIAVIKARSQSRRLRTIENTIRALIFLTVATMLFIGDPDLLSVVALLLIANTLLALVIRLSSVSRTNSRLSKKDWAKQESRRNG